MSRSILGIDPGKGGGIAVIDADTAEVIEVCAMPDTIADISDMIARHCDASCAYIEIVHSMPKQGVSSTFTFGQFYGYVQMAVVAHKIRCIDVLPSRWQQSLGVKAKKDEGYSAHKNRLKGLAQKLFPNVKVTLKNADALLIAYYGREKETGR